MRREAKRFINNIKTERGLSRETVESYQDDLKRVYGDIDGFKFTSSSKTAVVQRLIVAVEQRCVSWPAAWDVLTAEMGRYEYAISPSGGITYDAPSGYHDDCVIALALANYRRW